MPLILVADDRPLNRYFLTTLLSYYRYEVHEAGDGAEALQKIRARRPDVIIADVAMSGMDGPAMVKALRADPALASIPVIFYSASFSELEARAIAKKSGVDYVIPKPSNPEVILETVVCALDGRAPAESASAPLFDTREYVGRLQLAGIRMTALIELMAHLSSERDPDELLRTGCRAVRKIFGADAAMLVTGERAEADGDLRGSLPQLIDAVAPLAGHITIRAEAPAPLVDAVRKAMPDVRSALLAPMRSRGALYGWLLLANRGDAPPFGADDERLVLAAANHLRAEHESLRAAIAERQRVEAELQSYRGDVAALVDAAPVPVITLDLDRKVLSWNRAAERTFGYRAEEVIGRTNPAIPPEAEEEIERVVNECLDGKTVVGLEQRRIRKDGAVLDVSTSMAPLHDAEGRLRGFVLITADITALRASNESLRALSARVLSIQEEERTRLARELHDGVGQLLTAVKLDTARLLADVASGATPQQRITSGLLPLIDGTMETVVRLVSELRPSRVGEMGLIAAIEKKLADLRQRTDIATKLVVRPKTIQLPDDVATAAFRIAEEALTNVARHSGATQMNVTVEQTYGELRLVVEDNGRGIRESDRNSRNAYGLIGMKERAVVLGGSVEITGIEESGTAVIARIPLRGNSSVHRR
jgi:PAS domain S-box-containing protein